MKEISLPQGVKLTPAILAKLANSKTAREWRGDCPVCGYVNTFTVLIKPGRPLLLHCFNECPRKELYAAVSKITGKNWTPPKPPSKEEEVAAHAKKQAWAFKVWDASVPIVGTPGATYLASRCLPHLVNSKALRFNAEVSHPQRGKLPAIVALVVNVTGEPIAVHRTYLAPNGHGKAAVSPQKASLGPVSGGTIRLNALKPHTPLVIGEGLETSASAGLMMGAPAWAAISAGNMARNLALPPEVTEVIIAVDPDAPGRRAARRAGQRWRSEGRYVSFAYPPGTGDFNDLLCARKKEADHG